MTLLLKQIFGLIKLINSETGTYQIATGIAAGFVLGMTPVLSLQSLLVFILLFIFRIQIGAAFLAAFFFKFVAFLLDPVFDEIGRLVLTQASLEPTFTYLYNLPIVPFTRFNNTVVMGSGVVTLITSPLVFYVSVILIRKYRARVVAKYKQTQFWKMVQATSLYQWYYKYDKLFGQ